METPQLVAYLQQKYKNDIDELVGNKENANIYLVGEAHTCERANAIQLDLLNRLKPKYYFWESIDEKFMTQPLERLLYLCTSDGAYNALAKKKLECCFKSNISLHGFDDARLKEESVQVIREIRNIYDVSKGQKKSLTDEEFTRFEILEERFIQLISKREQHQAGILQYAALAAEVNYANNSGANYQFPFLCTVGNTHLSESSKLRKYLCEERNDFLIIRTNTNVSNQEKIDYAYSI